MVDQIVAAITEIMTGLGVAFTNVFENLTTIFYTPGTANSSGDLTFVGYISLIGLGISLLSMGINLVVKLTKAKK